MLDHSCQVQRHALRERKDDLYETPVVAVAALLRHERLPQRLWDPCCGPGNIVRVLRAAGHEVIGSDLVDYGDPTHFYRRDFLMEHKLPDGCEGVVMNPSFKLAEEFIAHALELCPLVIALLRLAFMESERRCGILEGRGLARIHVFHKRLPMMHRGGWEGRKANSGDGFCVVLLGSQLPRPDHDQSDLMGAPMTPFVSLMAQAETANQARHKGKRRSQMDMSRYASRKFIKPEDLESGPQRKTITVVEEGKYEKPVVTFEDGTRVSLNATNTSTLIAAFGSTNDEDWIGQKIELYVGTLRYNGSDNAAVLVRALNPSAPHDMNDEIPF